MIKRLMFLFILGGMLMVAKADTVVLCDRGVDAAWNVNANDGSHSSATFDQGFVEVADGTTIKHTNAFLDSGADHAQGDWTRGGAFDFQRLHGTDWGAGDTHFDWGHHHDGGYNNGSGSSGSGTVGTVATPEPGTIFLLSAGLLGFALLKLRK